MIVRGLVGQSAAKKGRAFVRSSKLGDLIPDIGKEKHSEAWLHRCSLRDFIFKDLSSLKTCTPLTNLNRSRLNKICVRDGVSSSNYASHLSSTISEHLGPLSASARAPPVEPFWVWRWRLELTFYTHYSSSQWEEEEEEQTCRTGCKHCLDMPT